MSPTTCTRELRARAAREGRSLSEFLLAELVRMGSRPTLDQLADRIRARDVAPPRADQPVVELIESERDARDAHLTAEH